MIRASIVLCTALALGACSQQRPSPPEPETGGGSGQQLSLPTTGGVRTGALSKEEREAQEKKLQIASAARWKLRLTTLKKKPAEELLKTGAREEAAQNHKDAAEAFATFVVHYPADHRMPVALRRSMRGYFALNAYADGFSLVEDAIRQTENPHARARLHRMAGNSYLAVPHWGLTRGGEFHRAQHGQGRSTQSYREDRARAVKHLETARTLMAEFAKPPLPPAAKPDPKQDPKQDPKAKPKTANGTPEEPVFVVAKLSDVERVETTFELIGAVARFTPYDAEWGYWWYAWASSEGDGLVDEEGADERAGRGRHYGWNQELYAARPKGLPVTPDGQIIFAKRPTAYSTDLDDVEKMKFLLEELRTTDKTADKDPSARSLLMQALLFGARDGVERLERLRNWWWQGSHPFKSDVEGRTLHTLKDDEVLGLVATHIQTFRLPPDESLPQLLTRLEEGFPKSDAADEAVYLLGQFFQSRKQYDKARAVYGRYLETRPKGPRRGSVQGALNLLDQQEVAVVAAGPQPAGRKATVNLRFRNVDKVDLKIRRVDQEKILADFKRHYKEGTTSRRDHNILQPGNLGYALVHSRNSEIERYASKVTSTATRSITPDKQGRYKDEVVDTGVTAPGLYVIDIHAAGKKTRLGRGLFVIEQLAMVQKRDTKGAFVWVVDAMTGAPIPDAKVERFEYWYDWKGDHEVRHSRLTSTRSDKRGVARGGKGTRQTLTTVRHGKSVTHVGWNYYYGRYYPTNNIDNATVALSMTDRPVYRPGDTVAVKVWARQKKDGLYLPAAGTRSIFVEVRDAQSAVVTSKTLKTDGIGAGHLEVPLSDDAPLGMYSIQVTVDGRGAQTGGGSFRVEEYKAPEFTVAVKAAGQARLGEKIKAEVAADYLFGGGVAGGKVTYKVYRQDHEQVLVAPGPWDWLYGVGYGRCYYAYGWFDWWGGYGPRPWAWAPWWGPKPEAPRELVKEGVGTLDDKGRFSLEIDTQSALEQRGKSDHKYTVAAEVVDLSRRLIKGEGSITVTRNAFFANIENEAGYWWHNESVKLAVTTRKPDGDPLAIKGKVVIEEVLYRDETGATLTHKILEELPVSTDVHGATRLTWRPKKTGQFRFTFIAKDAWGTEVRKSTVAWVVGPEWNGRTYRFNGLELLTDKRVYKPGETARLLVNVNQANASVLLATGVDRGVLLDYRIIKVKGKSMMVEVPVTAAHTPNFFVEATTVAEGTLFQEAREVFVPPQNAELKLEVKPNKLEYKPGEKAELEVTTTDLQGRPISADVAVSIFDTSVLYIQPELTPDVRQHFWAKKRTHSVVSWSSLTRNMNWGMSLARPDRQAFWTIRSASRRYFQHEINWRYKGSVDQLKGGESVGRFSDRGDLASGDSLADGEMNEEERQSGKKDSSSSFGARGKSKRKAEKSGRARENKKPTLESAAAAPSPVVGRVSAALEAPAEDDARASDKSEAGPGPKKAKKVRTNFADTAHFAPMVRTNASGKATVKFQLPDNLTTWRIKAIGLDANTRAGQWTSTIRTSKKLLVRLQAPRFFRERDRVVLSAIVHSKYDVPKDVEVSIEVTKGLLNLEGRNSKKVRVAPGGDKRVDFWVKVSGEGMAKVRMDAVADGDSDAKELSFPVLVHGMTKTVSSLGSIAADGPAEKSITLDIPKDRREDLSRLEVRFSPTLAGGMLDAIPYLLDYPYGCTEQTLSRFVPAVLTRRALQQAGGLKLEELGKAGKKNLNPQELTSGGKADAARLERRHKLMSRSPVFDTELLNDIIKSGLKRLGQMQNGDGGWGWWSRDGSSRYTTAHVVAGLLDAQEADLALSPSMLQRGKNALPNLVNQSLWRYDGHDWVGNDDAYAAWVMSRYKQKNDKLLGYLWERRQHLSPYGKLLAALTFFNLDDKKKAKTLFRNAEQILKNDDENETSWLETNRSGWWYWYNDIVETNALYLRALDTMRPKSKTAPRVVKWLLNNRKNGYYWRSTRDTAAVVAAFSNHMQKSGERNPDYDLEILLDDKVVKTVHIDKSNLFTFDNSLVLEGKALQTGDHQLTFRRKGKGAVYFNSYLSYFTTEEDVTAAGLEVKVNRTYYKLERRDRKHEVQGDRGQKLVSTEVAYAKVPLESGAKLKSGDLVLVELMLESKNDYTFLAFEDPKPAGMEPVALRSGSTYGEAVANMELRDEKVVFFLRTLTRGKLKLSYRLRAEIPGEFHAMPTFGFGMYAPELKANSDEMRFVIEDAP